MEALLSRGRQLEGARHANAALSVWDVERMVKGLRRHAVQDVGSAAWFEQHDALQQLNLQAHLNAQTHSDEFVKATLLDSAPDKLTLLVHELLVAEAWRERAFPLLAHHLASQLDSVAAYQLPFHEVALANLLEVLLFHPDAAEAAGEEALLELADWAARKAAYLGSAEAQEHAAYADVGVAALLERGAEEELRGQEREVQLGAALCGLTILRYLAEHSESVSLGLLARMMGSHDIVLALPPLLERPPWLRRGAGGRQERFSQGRWRRVEAEEVGLLGQPEAQAWLLLRCLLVSPAARAKLQLSDARREALMRMKRRLTPLLLDQLPVLRDLQRVLEEMSFGLWDDAAAPSVVVEQLPGMRRGILRGVDWAALAERQKQEQFGSAARALSQQRLESMMRGIDLLSGLEEGEEEAGYQDRVQRSRVMVDAYRRVRGDTWEWWATYDLELDAEKGPEPVTVPAGAAAGDENTPQGRHPGPEEGQPDAVIKGQRHRLVPLAEGAARALPGDAKLTVAHAGRSCEALLQLPTSDTRDTSALAPGLWVTAGGLRAHGLTLQLKLKRLDRPAERDGALGVWYPYAPAAGALTVREDLGA